jgi:hypothetical protein
VNVLRFLPAMNIGEELVHEGLDILTAVLSEHAG